MRARSLLVAVATALSLLVAPTPGAAASGEDARPRYPEHEIVHLTISDNTSILTAWRKARWPVRSAVAAWDVSPYLDLTYTNAPCSQVVGNCLPITTSRTGPDGWLAGYWFYGAHDVGYIELYESIQVTTFVREAIACHEIGHAFGFPHHDNGGCLGAPNVVVPSQWEMDKLAEWYAPVAPPEEVPSDVQSTTG